MSDALFTLNNITESWHLLEDCLILFKLKIPSGTKGLKERDTEPLQISKMELFVTIVYCFKRLTIIAKSSIQDIWPLVKEIQLPAYTDCTINFSWIKFKVGRYVSTFFTIRYSLWSYLRWKYLFIFIDISYLRCFLFLYSLWKHRTSSFRNSRPGCSVKKVFLKSSQNSQENICAKSLF